MKNPHIEDRTLAKNIISKCDNLERINDAVGCREIRHAISQRIVEIRLLARDGHLKNLNNIGERHPPNGD